MIWDNSDWHARARLTGTHPALAILSEVLGHLFLGAFTVLGLVILLCPWYWIFLTAAVVLGGFGISLFRTEAREGSTLDVESVRGNPNLATAVFFVVFAVYCLHLAHDDWTTRRAREKVEAYGPRIVHDRERGPTP